MTPPRPPRPTPSDELLEERPGVRLEDDPEDPATSRGETKASAGDRPTPDGDGEDDEPARVCPFCETNVPPLASDEKRHRACVDAWGCDYDPTDGYDAQAWLDRRQAWIEAETKAGRLKTATLDVSDLRLHPDLSDEGN